MTNATGLKASLTKKKDIDLSVLEKNINKLHPQLESKKAPADPDEDMIKFNVFLPKDVHKKIKIYCTEQDLNIKDFCSEAIIDKANDHKII